MILSCYLVEAAIYGGVAGVAILLASVFVGFVGLAAYLVFGW